MSQSFYAYHASTACDSAGLLIFSRRAQNCSSKRMQPHMPLLQLCPLRLTCYDLDSVVAQRLICQWSAGSAEMTVSLTCSWQCLRRVWRCVCHWPSCCCSISNRILYDGTFVHQQFFWRHFDVNAHDMLLLDCAWSLFENSWDNPCGTIFQVFTAFELLSGL